MPFSVAIRFRISFKYAHLFLPGFILGIFERCGKDIIFFKLVVLANFPVAPIGAWEFVAETCPT
jgi:hypothetical protein